MTMLRDDRDMHAWADYAGLFNDNFASPPVPFGSKQWPTLVTTGPGPKSIADLP